MDLPLGCDAVNMMLMGFIAPAMFRLEPNWVAISLLSAAFLTFYAATWEEYHTGSLYLGYISGPVEGTLIVISLCLVGAYYGGSIWTDDLALPYGVTVKSSMLVVYPTLFFSVATVITSMFNVYKKSGLYPILNLVPFSLIAALTITVYALSPEMTSFPNFVLFFLTWGFAFASAVAQIIVAHISKGPFPLWTPAFLPLIISALRLINGHYRLVPLFLEGQTTLFLTLSLAFCLCIYLRLVVGIINQICRYLKISCFFVTPNRAE